MLRLSADDQSLRTEHGEHPAGHAYGSIRQQPKPLDMTAQRGDLRHRIVRERTQYAPQRFCMEYRDGSAAHGIAQRISAVADCIQTERLTADGERGRENGTLRCPQPADSRYL